MKFSTNRIWNFYFIISLFILVICLFYKDSTIDFQRHDTYYVVAIFHLGIVLAVLNLLLGFLYWLCKKLISIKVLTILHFVISTIIIFIILYLTIYRNSELLNSNTWEGIRLYRRNQWYIIVSIIIWILSTSFILINISISILTNSSRKNNLQNLNNKILDNNRNE